MPSETPALTPIKTDFRLNFLSDQQLDAFQEATLQVLEETGVQFPSQKALHIFKEHGATVDVDSQVVKIPRQMVKDAMAKVLVPPPLAKSDEILAESGGMFYPRESPDSDVYVKEGDHFDAGDPLFIIEVMKMFNKVYAPFAGTVDEVLVKEDGVIIKKGQPIFKITPDEKIVVESPEEIAARRTAVTRQFLQKIQGE